MSILTNEHKEEKLGTFISQRDLNKILTGSTFSSQITKSYFVDSEEERINRIMEFVEKIANILLETIPVKIVQQVMVQFQKILPRLLESNEDKYFTKNTTANHFLALIDYRLSLVGSKLSPKHIKNIIDLTTLKKGKAFSYFAVKQAQEELIAAGYIKRRRQNTLHPLLKTKVTQICSSFIQAFPLYEEKFHEIREKGYRIIELQKFPQIDADEAALILIAALFPYFFSIKEINEKLWLFIQFNYGVELKSFKQRVYRFRCVLRKETMFKQLLKK